MRTAVAPIHNVVRVEYARALMWNSGRWTRWTSSAVSPSWAALTLAVQRALAWVSTTALGSDVVPDVYWIHAGASGAMSAGVTDAPSPRSASKRSSRPGRSAGATPASVAVTATHRRPGSIEPTIDANFGWVMAATARECSPK